MSQWTIPGTYWRICTKCGGWTAWCMHDAPRQTIEEFHVRSRAEGSKVVSRLNDQADPHRRTCKEREA